MQTQLEHAKRVLANEFDSTLQEMCERRCKCNFHSHLPDSYFGWASSETRDLFTHGHYYGCITLVQSVAEGIAKFLAEKNGLHKNYYRDHSNKVSQAARVLELLQKKKISIHTRNAFQCIAGNDRNNFHHLNRNIETDSQRLERRAQECIEALYKIESEVFAFTTTDGLICPSNPHYWNIVNGKMNIFIKASCY